MTAHVCHAAGCNVVVPPRMFMCRRHWFMLPRQMRGAIWDAYIPGQEIRKDPTAEYLDEAVKAIRWLADKEGRNLLGEVVRNV